MHRENTEVTSRPGAPREAGRVQIGPPAGVPDGRGGRRDRGAGRAFGRVSPAQGGGCDSIASASWSKLRWPAILVASSSGSS
ncbi:hypothetical protein GCM10009735_63290 [Actinomadura chokoriensis]